MRGHGPRRRTGLPYAASAARPTPAPRRPCPADHEASAALSGSPQAPHGDRQRAGRQRNGKTCGTRLAGGAVRRRLASRLASRPPSPSPFWSPQRPPSAGRLRAAPHGPGRPPRRKRARTTAVREAPVRRAHPVRPASPAPPEPQEAPVSGSPRVFGTPQVNLAVRAGRTVRAAQTDQAVQAVQASQAAQQAQGAQQAQAARVSEVTQPASAQPSPGPRPAAPRPPRPLRRIPPPRARARAPHGPYRPREGRAPAVRRGTARRAAAAPLSPPGAIRPGQRQKE